MEINFTIPWFTWGWVSITKNWTLITQHDIIWFSKSTYHVTSDIKCKQRFRHLFFVIAQQKYIIRCFSSLKYTFYVFKIFKTFWKMSYLYQYNTIQYNCLFRAPIAKNKFYSKALYIVQCTVTVTDFWGWQTSSSKALWTSKADQNKRHPPVAVKFTVPLYK